MLEKPGLPDPVIFSGLRDHYGLRVGDVTFLPLGADANTAVYRILTDNDTAYFLKLRSGAFDETTVAVPKFLHDAGITSIIAPIANNEGHLWATLDRFKAILFPFIEGTDAFEVPLTDDQWVAVGRALRRIHSIDLPTSLRAQIPSEDYGPYWRDRLREFQEFADGTRFVDTVAAEFAALLRARRETIDALVTRAEELTAIVRAASRPNVLCHGDIHAWNVLVTTDGDLYIVDWDTIVLAPKERDLMYIGAGIGGVWNSEREARLFQTGYGHSEIDDVALAYYRYERIVEDFAAFAEELLSTDAGGADRVRSLRFVAGQFEPGDVIEIAFQSDPRWATE